MGLHRPTNSILNEHIMETQELEKPLELAMYFRVVFKYRIFIFFCIVVSFLFALNSISRIIPIYVASSTILIDSERSTSPLTGRQTEYSSYYHQTTSFNTHLSLIVSRPVLIRVIKALKWDQPGGKEQKSNPPKGVFGFIKSYLYRIKSKIIKNIRLLLGKKEKKKLQGDRTERLVRILKAKININEIEETRLLRIAVEDYNPSIAMKIANETARAYIEFDIHSKLKSSRHIMNWMTDQLYETKKNLEDAEQDFVEYKRDQKLFSIEGKQNVITDQLNSFNMSYLKVRNRRLEIESVLAELKTTVITSDNISRARKLIESQRLDNLYTQLLDLEVEETQLGKVFRGKHPRMIQIRGKQSEIEAKLRDELKKEVDSLKTEHSLLLSKEKVLKETISGFENDALDTNKKELQYSILERNVNMNQHLYDTLLKKIRETSIVDNLDLSNIRIVEEAPLPRAPKNPHKKRILLLSIILGAIVGATLSFVFEYLDQSIHIEEDVHNYLGLPVLSVIPKAKKPEDADMKATEDIFSLFSKQ